MKILIYENCLNVFLYYTIRPIERSINLNSFPRVKRRNILCPVLSEKFDWWLQLHSSLL